MKLVAFLAGLFLGVAVMALSVTYQAMRNASEPFVEPYPEYGEMFV